MGFHNLPRVRRPIESYREYVPPENTLGNSFSRIKMMDIYKREACAASYVCTLRREAEQSWFRVETSGEARGRISKGYPFRGSAGKNKKTLSFTLVSSNKRRKKTVSCARISTCVRACVCVYSHVRRPNTGINFGGPSSRACTG